MGRPPNTPDNFWSYVRKGAPTECWLWTGGTHTWHGMTYGCVTWGRKSNGAHRKAYELTYGEVEKGLVVRHTCDVPLCCNPSHLRIGTPQDNRNDCVEKNRHAFGTRNAGAKFSEDEVLLIRDMFKGGISGNAIAKHLGVPQVTISRICSGSTWKHLPV